MMHYASPEQLCWGNTVASGGKKYQGDAHYIVNELFASSIHGHKMLIINKPVWVFVPE